MSTDKTAAETPTPDAGAGDTDTDGIDVETVGVEEIVRQERVRSIFESRKKCRERRLEAKDENDPTIFRDALEGYIREVEGLFQQTEEGEEYWKKHNFGTIELTPHRSDLPEKYDEIKNVADTHGIRFKGLMSLFQAGDPIIREAEVHVPSLRRGPGRKVEKVVFARPIPFDILDAMFSATNNYLSDIGFGVQVDKAQQNTKLDDDLMQEVEQWRRENL